MREGMIGATAGWWVADSRKQFAHPLRRELGHLGWGVDVSDATLRS